MSITHARDVLGRHQVIEEDPPILEVRDALYSPLVPGHHWGLYHPDGTIIRESAFYQGGAEPSGQLTTTHLHEHVAKLDRAPDDVTYVYGGIILDHFGHFLVSTASRYWKLDLYRDPNVRILYHSAIDIREQFARPYLAQLFEAIGLPVERWQRFGDATLVPKVLVPAPAFVETDRVHKTFATSMKAVGERLTAGVALEPDDRPVYFSKEKMTGGTGRIDNEHEMTEVLSREGVQILFPEEMSLVEQIAIFRTRRNIFGHVGSALHVSIFGDANRIVAMNPVSRMFSSYAMIDEVVGSNATYVFPENDIIELPREGPFYNRWVLTDPKRTAREFLDFANAAAPPRRRLPRFVVSSP